MAKLEKHLRKTLVTYMNGVKEDNRDPDTGILDTRGMVAEALKLWHQDDPEAWAEYMEECAIYTGTVEFEKDAQNKRSSAHTKLDNITSGLDEEDFDDASVGAWNMPDPKELNLEYHARIESGGVLPERLGDMTVPQVFALADYHEKREASARKWKNYFRRVGYVALYWKKRKALGDDATLWNIFDGEAKESA